jgi:hypothetical protein
VTTDRLKVLFITHSFPLAGAGPQAASLQLLADALAAHGADVCVVAPDRGGQAGASGDAGDVRVQRFTVSGKGKSDERGSRRLAMKYLGAGFGSAVRAHRDFEPDIVHAHWWFPSGLVGSWVSSLAEVPLITSLHGFDPASVRAGSPARSLFRHVLRLSTRVTVETRADAALLAADLNGIAPIIAPLPLDTSLFCGATRDDGLAVVVTSGDHHTEAADAVESLRRLRKTVVLAVAGAADEQSRSVARGAGCQLLNADDGAALATALNAAGLVVVCGEGAAARATAHAAMLSGAPLALTQRAAGEQLLSDAAQFAWFPPASASGNSEAFLRSLGATPQALRDRASAAQTWARSSVSPEACAAMLMGVYLRTLEEIAA